MWCSAVVTAGGVRVEGPPRPAAAAETCQGNNSSVCDFVFPALHLGVWGHHRHPAHPGRAALHQGQQPGQKSAHLHHFLRFGIMYAAANNRGDEVASSRSPYADERKLNCGNRFILSAVWSRRWEASGWVQHLPMQAPATALKKQIPTSSYLSFSETPAGGHN